MHENLDRPEEVKVSSDRSFGEESGGRTFEWRVGKVLKGSHWVCDALPNSCTMRIQTAN